MVCLPAVKSSCEGKDVDGRCREIKTQDVEIIDTAD
jgi:hypothetical protein